MVCPESISTLSVVSHCPSNATEWVSAAKRKSCNDLGKVQSCTEPDQFVYHCVLNQEATQLLEVCAPVWFLSGKCLGDFIQSMYIVIFVTCFFNELSMNGERDDILNYFKQLNKQIK